MLKIRIRLEKQRNYYDKNVDFIIEKKLFAKLINVNCKTRNQPQTSQIIYKPPTNQPNHPQTSQIPDKSPTNPPTMSRKLVFYVTRNFSNNANSKHVLSLQALYSITLTFSSKDQSQVGIERK